MTEEREKKRGKNGKNREKTDYSGYYVIASSRPPERRPLERCPLVPIKIFNVEEEDEKERKKQDKLKLLPNSGKLRRLKDSQEGKKVENVMRKKGDEEEKD